MTRRLIGFNIAVALLGVVFAVALGRELLSSRPLPGPPQIRPAVSDRTAEMGRAAVQPQPDSAATGAVSAGGAALEEVIASQNLFDPSRSAAGAGARPTGPRPLLYGVVAGDGVKGRAYVEDPATKAVRGYQVGDTVAGWRLDQIREDRVVITGSERGMLEVLLREPGKPRPALVASAAVTVEAQTAGAPGAPPAGQAPASDGVVPRGIGPIPSQLFRPAQARANAPQAMPGAQQ